MTYKSLEKLFYMDRSTDRYASNEKMALPHGNADTRRRALPCRTT